MEPTYEMLIGDETKDGVFAISLVDSPAIQTDYVLLSNEKDKISIELKLEKLQDQKRRIVCGPALVPDMVIARKGYNIVFSKDTIRKISENFLINNYKDNVTLQHQMSVNKIYLVESWIVEDPKNDKATKLGFNVPEGTWMVSFKILDEQLWTEYVESGILKGFSIEGNFSKHEVNLDAEIEHIVHTLLRKAPKPSGMPVITEYELADLDSYYKWKMSSDIENCPACLENSGKVKKLSQWLEIGMPRVKNGTEINFTDKGNLYTSLNTDYTKTNPKKDPYGTFCEAACHCELVRVIKNPVANYKKYKKTK